MAEAGGKFPVWQITGATLALIAILVTVAIFWIAESKKEKDLEATILSTTALLNPGVESARRNIKVLYNDREIENFSIIQVRIQNSGAQPIRTSDIEKEIEIELENVAEIVSADVIAQQPDDIN